MSIRFNPQTPHFLKTHKSSPEKLNGMATTIPITEAILAWIAPGPSNVTAKKPTPTLTVEETKYTKRYLGICPLIERPLAENERFLLKEKLKPMAIKTPKILEITNPTPTKKNRLKKARSTNALAPPIMQKTTNFQCNFKSFI
jgi:hypothetical protein|tara:strand:+ start:1848 stop:2276 length:429 start_codon:yes stop_codon:yes gene_type:complete